MALPVKNLPTIPNILLRACQLYGKAFIPILPFTILYALGAFFFNKTMPEDPTQHVVLTLPHVLTFISLGVGFILLYNWILYGVYQKQQNEPIHYENIIMRGLSRFFPVLFAYILVMIPFLILGILGASLTGLAQASELAATAMVFSLLILFSIISFFIVYFAVGPLHIVAKNAGPIAGLGRSWCLVRGHLWKTVSLFLILGILSGFLTLGLEEVMGDYAIPIVTLIFAPLWASLTVVYNQDLENAIASRAASGG